jgi:hypothetical protein
MTCSVTECTQKATVIIRGFAFCSGHAEKRIKKEGPQAEPPSLLSRKTR